MSFIDVSSAQNGEAAATAARVVKCKSKTVTTERPPRPKKLKADATAPAQKNEVVSSQDLVLDYMRQQNRPYNLQLVYDNLKRAIKKPELERLLDQLVADNFLICKEIGKTRVFMYCQKRLGGSSPCTGDMSSEIQELKEEIKRLEQCIKQRTNDQQKIREVCSRGAQLDSLQIKVASAEAQIKAIKGAQESGCKLVTSAEASDTEFLHAKSHAAWATQKRRCLELVKLVCERMQVDETQLQEELGLERDEDFIPTTAYLSYGQ